MFYLWYPQGRLGNLIFQYQAISNIAAGNRVVALSNDFFDLFEASKCFSVLPFPKRGRWRAERLWIHFLDFAARRRIVGTIRPATNSILENTSSETNELITVHGALKSVFVVKGFFQTALYQSPLPHIRDAAKTAAEGMLADIPRARRVALHMRFGDYATWPVFGIPGLGALPAAYYHAAIDAIRGTVPDAVFIVISDDRPKAAEVLDRQDVDIRFVDGGSALNDFTLITCCAHAIQSASSYSWWAAALIAQTPPAQPMLVAPKYWLGFRKRRWYPAEIASDRFTYIEFAAS